MRWSALPTWAATLPRIGLANILRVAVYRIGLRLALHPACRVSAPPADGPFFPPSVATLPAADSRAPGGVWLFGRRWMETGDQAPDWFRNPLDGRRHPAPDSPWWRIPDFDPVAGDIKGIWELSRLDWLLPLARDARARPRLEDWLQDWCRRNPPYLGPNWKCGQEASLRVLRLATVHCLLGRPTPPTPGLVALLRAHLRRIAPTLQYAVAQDNNHATSEAAALFVGGSWLAAAGLPDGADWERRGRERLESSVHRLFGDDGGFSQYSTNYHRLALDTVSLAEAWRRLHGRPAFSGAFLSRARAAAAWLHAVTDADTGDAPCIGANDGAHLLPGIEAPAYRDHRPSVQLATSLFAGQCAYPGPGPWNDWLDALAVETAAEPAPPPASRAFDDGGFAVLHRDGAMAVMRYPRFRFRPSQADALHVDLRVHGRNLLADAGSYGYAADPADTAYFSGTAAHNTVQFDDRDQMPRLGRFLFGRWLRASGIETLAESGDGTTFAAGYRDADGASHHRSLRLSAGRLVVRDRIAGFRQRAVLRWRLPPGPVRLEGRSVAAAGLTLAIDPDCELGGIELASGWESRHYGEKTPVQVLEVELRRPGSIITHIAWRT